MENKLLGLLNINSVEKLPGPGYMLRKPAGSKNANLLPDAIIKIYYDKYNQNDFQNLKRINQFMYDGDNSRSPSIQNQHSNRIEYIKKVFIIFSYEINQTANLV